MPIKYSNYTQNVWLKCAPILKTSSCLALCCPVTSCKCGRLTGAGESCLSRLAVLRPGSGGWCLLDMFVCLSANVCVCAYVCLFALGLGSFRSIRMICCPHNSVSIFYPLFFSTFPLSFPFSVSFCFSLFLFLISLFPFLTFTLPV